MTEDRFKKMTTMQWVFHYLEIMKVKSRKAEREDNLFDILFDRIEAVGFMANPELGQKVLDSRNTEKIKKDVETGEEDLIKYFESIKDTIPDKITVAPKDKSKSKFFLPTRKLNRKKVPTSEKEEFEKELELKIKPGIEFKEGD